MTPLQITVLVTLLGILAFAVYMMVRSIEDRKKFSSIKTTYGFAGKQGDTVEFSCPAGKQISVYRANYICADQTSEGIIANPNCDPDMNANGDSVDENNNPISHAVDASLQVASQVNGKQTASFVVPSTIVSGGSQVSLNSSVCSSGSCQNVYVAGTYNCIPL